MLFSPLSLIYACSDNGMGVDACYTAFWPTTAIILGYFFLSAAAVMCFVSYLFLKSEIARKKLFILLSLITALVSAAIIFFCLFYIRGVNISLIAFLIAAISIEYILLALQFAIMQKNKILKNGVSVIRPLTITAVSFLLIAIVWFIGLLAINNLNI